MNNTDDQLTRAAVQLGRDGYCMVPDVLDQVMLRSLLDRFSDRKLSDAPKEQFGDSGGFIIADYHDPVLVSLLAWPKTLEILRSFGFAAPKLHNFYVSAKPPQAEALPWHSDLFYRYDKSEPAELFLIYYLQDTTPDNGCLRVVPGSHAWPHDKRHAQPEDAARRDDEVDVEVKAGDLFIGDRRIMHATYANAGNTWRTCLTIAYAPLFDTLAEPIKALLVQNRCLPPAGWWDKPHEDIDPCLAAILPVYKGTADPAPIEG